MAPQSPPPRASGLIGTELAPPPPPPRGLIGTELAPPPPKSPGVASTTPPRTPSPSPNRQETPSPPSKRRRGRSTPPPDPALPSPPRRRSSSMPPSPTRRGDIMSSEDKAMASAPESGSNRPMMCAPKLEYSRARQGGELGPVAILWDIENCCVPKDAVPGDISYHIRKALGMHHNLSGDVAKFCAYGDFNLFPTRIREELKSSGIQVVHIPHEQKKETADKAILVEMLFFAMDNHVPSCIMLISGDVDFAPALHGLQERSYTIAIALPCSVHVSSELTSAAEVVWDWASLARGKGVGIPRPLCPGDLQVLKGELIQLLGSTENGSLLLSKIPGAYLKHFLRPLVITHYDFTKLDDLFKKMGTNSFLILGGGTSMAVYLNTNSAIEEVGASKLVRAPEKATDMSDLHEDQATTAPSCMDEYDCVNTRAVPTEEEAEVEDVRTGPSKQATPIPEVSKKSRWRRHRHRR